MPDLTPETLAELQRLAEAATPNFRPGGMDPATVTIRASAMLALLDRLDGAEAVIEVQDAHARQVIAERDALTDERDSLSWQVEALRAERDARSAERDALAAKVEATPKTPLPALGDTSGTPSMIGGRVCRILGDCTAPMPPIERVGWYRELAHTLSVAADKWERYLAEEAARADQ